MGAPRGHSLSQAWSSPSTRWRSDDSPPQRPGQGWPEAIAQRRAAPLTRLEAGTPSGSGSAAPPMWTAEDGAPAPPAGGRRRSRRLDLYRGVLSNRAPRPALTTMVGPQRTPLRPPRSGSLRTRLPAALRPLWGAFREDCPATRWCMHSMVTASSRLVERLFADGSAPSSSVG